MSAYIGRRGQVGAAPAGGLSSAQKSAMLVAAVLVGPALLKRAYDTPASSVDLSAWKIVSHYDTPAIERHDGVLRVEFCAS